MVTLWKHRNKIYFEDTAKSEIGCKHAIQNHVTYAAKQSKGKNHQTQVEKDVMSRIGIEMRRQMPDSVQSCTWIPPAMGVIKWNCDGSAMAGMAGYGIVARDHDANFKMVVAKGLGQADNYWAESLAIIEAAEASIVQGWGNIWIESDSLAVVEDFNRDKAHWKLLGRWKTCKTLATNITLSHIYREGNFTADCVAKRASEFHEGEMESYFEKPTWIVKWETPFSLYLRFKRL
ncbi:hypothetical protein ACHQM5_018074 [Ranunculus cassubicifolius]